FSFLLWARYKVTTTAASLILLGSAIASLDGVGFGHVFALLRLSVVAGTGLVIDAGIGVDPDHAVAVGRRGLLCGGLRVSVRGGRRRGGGAPRWAWTGGGGGVFYADGVCGGRRY